MASKPTVVLYDAVMRWLTPSSSVAPASPVSRPAAVIVKTMMRRGDIPAYLAASGLAPAVLISNPSVVRKSTQPYANGIRAA